MDTLYFTRKECNLKWSYYHLNYISLILPFYVRTTYVVTYSSYLFNDNNSIRLATV